jgi:hypothetical protein
VSSYAIFWPVIALVGVTASVWVRMYFVRIGEMRTRRIHPQKVATSRAAAGVLEDVATADNFRNLFEVPVLFYAVCGALVITDTVTPLQLALAWGFVLARAAHSFVHITYNRVMHRFLIYVTGTVFVFLMWAVFAYQLISRQG